MVVWQSGNPLCVPVWTLLSLPFCLSSFSFCLYRCLFLCLCFYSLFLFAPVYLAVTLYHSFILSSFCVCISLSLCICLSHSVTLSLCHTLCVALSLSRAHGYRQGSWLTIHLSLSLSLPVRGAEQGRSSAAAPRAMAPPMHLSLFHWSKCVKDIQFSLLMLCRWKLGIICRIDLYLWHNKKK